jgi:hypothetical protein
MAAAAVAAPRKNLRDVLLAISHGDHIKLSASLSRERTLQRLYPPNFDGFALPRDETSVVAYPKRSAKIL